LTLCSVSPISRREIGLTYVGWGAAPLAWIIHDRRVRD
jgi:hypothetical protein